MRGRASGDPAPSRGHDRRGGDWGHGEAKEAALHHEYKAEVVGLVLRRVANMTRNGTGLALGRKTFLFGGTDEAGEN